MPSKRNNTNYLKNRAGLSLVELLVVLALLNIVLFVAYSFSFFGTRAFSVGEKQSNLQQQVRTAADFITKDLRYATDIALLENISVIPDPVTNPDDFYIFLNASNAIEFRSIDGSRVLLDPAMDNINLVDFEFYKRPNNSLEFNIQAQRETEDPYHLTTTILPENLALLQRDIVGFNNGIGVLYHKVPPVFPVSILVNPFSVNPWDSLSKTFIINIISVEFENILTGDPSLVTLGGDFTGTGSSLTVTDIYKADEYTASITLSGTLAHSTGIATITVHEDALLGSDDPLTGRVIVYPKERILTVIKVGGGGLVEPSNFGTHNYNFEDDVTLKATNTGGWDFAKWVINGAVFDTPEVDITMDANKTAIAYFETPLSNVPGGNYVRYNGTNYLKLTGNNNKVMHLNLSGNKFNWDATLAAQWPSRAELDGDNWSDSRRLVGGDEYWTSTHDPPSDPTSTSSFTVRSNGLFSSRKKNNSLKIRLTEELPLDSYVYDGDGSQSNPYRVTTP